MSTYDPEELLSQWKQHGLDVEMAMGHVLQNLVQQQVTQAAKRQLQGTLNQHQREIQALRADVTQMQTDIDRLTAQVDNNGFI